jgi:hypothetical protein
MFSEIIVSAGCLEVYFGTSCPAQDASLDAIVWYGTNLYLFARIAIRAETILSVPICSLVAAGTPSE